ncbi:MAG TPA: nucleotide sugar dehydrogenase [Candidatus Wujingus californicus]|uniref:nucleotide sugar dehydrogenase n=2 Tax=Candidatus Wujingus californicus TaxID=3367618 RepID=UPI001D934F73|nr:nucleotide sugar dehydrogenase [Planctomycetota bacterium]MDO8131038.1 nucleotide sugar dehydrogenase [Candidatus Brocadiales bacterium]
MTQVRVPQNLWENLIEIGKRENMAKSVLKKLLVAKSPFGEIYNFNSKSDDIYRINDFINRNRKKKIVVVQGLGFVGSAMLTAVASAEGEDRLPLYGAIGVDLPTVSTYWKIGRINEGKFPINCSDDYLLEVFDKCFKKGNIMSTADKYAYRVADIIVVDINMDVEKFRNGKAKEIKVLLDDFVIAMNEVAKNIKPSCLVIVESTIPPGTCEKILVPLFESEFRKRGYKNPKINIVHSYERVMPGKNYLKSITSFYRVFSGVNKSSKKGAKIFFESIIDTEHYPLTELQDTTASEMGKVLENSYRAVNIAFMQEWTEFADTVGVNLYEVIEGIKKRDTHRNIMYPGFGVGGYCLTKDPLLADWSKQRLFNCPGPLYMSVEAVSINDEMPLYSFNLLTKHLRNMREKRILLMGVSYLKDVADTRFSPSELFYKKCIEFGACVILHDPIVNYWPELNRYLKNDLKSIEGERVDAIILAVKHDEYLHMKPRRYARLLKKGGLIMDCNNIIDDKKAHLLRKRGYRVIGVGKGHWNRIL